MPEGRRRDCRAASGKRALQSVFRRPPPFRTTMNVIIRPHTFTGDIAVPASKSHTIRRLIVGALAGGESVLRHPLDSLDAASCVSVCRLLGAEVDCGDDAAWRVRGVGGAAGIKAPAAPLDVGNSGTTLFLALAAAALASHPIAFTGDEQTARRSALPLLDALRGLSVAVESSAGGCIPITVQGPMKSGRVSLPCPTSQYLSALLLSAPLSSAGTVVEIDVPLLNEKPYIEMTLAYLREQNVRCTTNDDFSYFRIEGGAAYRPLSGPVPGDFSSAAFPAAAAALSGGRVVLRNLDPNDCQGDKAFFEMLSAMGCAVRWEKASAGGDETQEVKRWTAAVSRPGPLRGGTFDLNATPDLLPAAAALAAYACGETRLENVQHARIKETDRIACMAAELTRLGVPCAELPDGIVIQGQAGRFSPPRTRENTPITLDGHGDHRIVMALAVAALGAATPIEITDAEAADVTYPGFLALLQ
ncbi:MAG: 3-phosphoshikimate 1-carboxyvinyltransferase [Spirochaetaceae bacterium]|jgi:3-phosphoshikimate 1-carboxyvinyltransferase|nr:3-phosphoshikimate 1-carboxyvinyltransferase [Spirochaetaceae bacterium]